MDGRARGNPWNRGGHQSNQTRKKPGGDPKPGKKPTSGPTSEDKFREAQARLQASVQKHIKPDYESSSEEEELESDNILGSVLKSYSQVGGKSEDLGRTQRFLEDAFQSGAAVCLICIGSVKRTEAIWNCVECYCFFHLTCIQRWARDSIAFQKQALEDLPHQKGHSDLQWSCPKCRHDYSQNDIPQRYYCFCNRMEDPPFHPWLVPHSCGETCGRPLQPLCGHDCLLLCHPGPCPPCPKTVKNTCHCRKQPPRLQRCSNKIWSCGSHCGHKLGCGRHDCTEICHPGDCPPCPKTSMQYCQCGDKQMLRPCADPVWNCNKVCNKPLSCGHHFCEKICHAGPCGDCPLTGARTCPCGKTSYNLACTEEVPTCGDTCGRLLECGAHTCSRPCHQDKCGTCLEVVTKTCRCGLHEKEQPCRKEYLCDTKCKRVKDCSRHPCNRKCCDGNCPPCEKPCGRTLTCGNHKCASVCHRGPCYPCPSTAEVKCRCGHTVLVVPCGRKKKTRPPRCMKLCRIEPDCHHPQREPHRCHFGDCPPCRQVCGLPHDPCGHSCSAMCHSAVWVKVGSEQKPAGPWEKVEPQLELRALPCPDCKVPVAVSCLGGHEISEWPCYIAVPTCCHRPCGRKLACGNHTCTIPCHKVEGARDEINAGSNCEVCEAGCTKERPEGCSHQCFKPCHPGDCPPCSQMVRMSCHCLVTQLYVRCSDWTSADDDKKVALLSCGNQCPKNYACGHRCRSNCHLGDCPNEDACRKKVKLTCPCKRLRREFTCDVVRAGQIKVDCDDTCKLKKEEEKKARELELEQKRLEEERRNQEELERFQKKFQGRKKQRDRRHLEEEEKHSLVRQYWAFICGVLAVLLGAYLLISKPVAEESSKM
ncbi:NF-X1-type zinc finger protein NFXL1 [Anabrus simplex]|uniref:NF-X1-type zinc finger protein NFXL1 n=1 Tax=Anabrus simplex TaxID=316456 RepID=UPI0035A39AE9